MILGTLSLALLVLAVSFAYRTEQAVERGDKVSTLQLWAGGLLIVGGLALIGFGLEWTPYRMAYALPGHH